MKFAISHKVNVDLKGMKENMLSAYEQALDKKVILLANEIRSRTRRGVDVNNGAFKPYSARYAARKGAVKLSGKKGKKYASKNLTSGGALKVDLTVQGGMLTSITQEIKRIGNAIVARIYFSDAAQAKKAKIHNEGVGKMPKRNFFDLSQKQLSSLKAVLRKVKNNKR